ncbi:FHA domain-containing protein, partial [Delftia tsuruhatensis]|uniref:FHA domain-containing protein n=1 Tax=Delftia tsuruhatensis TaxID=180282 RepID=UPI001EF51CB4
MQLQLIASAMSAAGAVDKISTTFGTAGGSIGRDVNCQMVLPDPHRRISRIQAQVFFEESHFILNNASSSNPIYVNGIELKPGENSPIRHGDEWRAGNYIITVLQSNTLAKSPPADPRGSTQSAGAALATPPPTLSSAAQDKLSIRPDTAQPPGPFDDLLSASVEIPPAFAGEPSRHGAPDPSPQLADPFANPGISPPVQAQAVAPPALGGDPFADILSTSITQQIAQAPGQEQRWQSQAAIPDDFDPMAMASLSSRNAADPLHGLSGTGTVGEMFPQGSVDSIFSPSGTSIEPMTRNPLDASAHDSVLKINRGLDPLAMFSSKDAGPPHSLLDGDFTESSDADDAPVFSNHTSELGAFFRPPTPSRQSPQEDPYSPIGASTLPAQPASAPGEEPYRVVETEETLPQAVPQIQTPRHDA